MLKSKKIVILFVIISVICILSGYGAMSGLKQFYGVYVCSTDKDSKIEFLDFNIPKRTATVNFCNVSFPKHKIAKFSQKAAKAKVFKKKGKLLFFITIIEGKKVIGSLDVVEKKVDIGGIVFVRTKDN